MQSMPKSGDDYPVQAATPMLGPSPPFYENPVQPPPVMTGQQVFFSAPQTTVVNIETSVSVVPDYLPWSIFNSIYMNFCCLGICALVYSVKSRDRKMAKDQAGAVSYGSTARSLNIAATVLSVLTVVIAVIVAISLTFAVANRFSGYFPYKRYNTGY